MRITRKSFTPLLLAGAATVAVLAAPTAAADPQSCTYLGAATQCVSPGNSQLIATPPLVQQQPTFIIFNRFGVGHRF